MSTTWVLVADTSRARIFQAKGPLGPLHEIETLLHPESRLHARDLTSDLPGRSFDSHGQGRHSMEMDVDPKQHETLIFVKQISDRLDSAKEGGEFEQLILVAPPALLGLLRKQLDSGIMQRVVHQLDKNIAQFRVEEIRQHLPEKLS